MGKPQQEISSELEAYILLLKDRLKCLEQLAATTCLLRRTMEMAGRTGSAGAIETASSLHIDKVLARREDECKRCAASCRRISESDKCIEDKAREAANSDSPGVRQAAHEVMSVLKESQSLVQMILKSQAECEETLKSSIEKTGAALRDSIQKRKLSQAYGPACSYRSASFLDKQQ